MRQLGKPKIITLILLDIILFAILLSCICGNSNKPSRQTPNVSQTPSATAPTTVAMITPVPGKQQNMTSDEGSYSNKPDNQTNPSYRLSVEAPNGSVQDTAEPSNAADNSKPAEPSKPAENSNAAEPAKPVNPSVTPTPLKPSEPANTAEKPLNGGVNEMPLNTDLPYFRKDYAERYARYYSRNPDLPVEQVVLHVNIGLDMGFYHGVKLAANPDSILALVNKFNKLPDDFKPTLKKLPDSLCVPGVGEQYLREEALQALQKMHEDAKKEGLNIRAYGTYRSISTQKTIWNNAVNSGRTIDDVDSLNARGGHSEHHTGLAVDVIKNNYTVMNMPEYQWYKDKAHEYGFIIRYPEGKEHITGYKFEPWHLRYVGPEIAEKVYKSGLTYDEYYAEFIEQ